MTLLNSIYTYPVINRDSSTGKRLYDCPSGEKLPSVTTILDATKSADKKQMLANWRARQGETKAKEITLTASGRGTKMHKFLEDYIAQGFLSEHGTLPISREAHIMASSIIDKGVSNLTEVWGSEVNLYYPGLYAGTTDGVGIHNGEPAIFDFKQTNKPKKIEWIEDYYLQLCSYALAHNILFDTNIKKGVVLMAVAPVDGVSEYQEFILEGDQFTLYANKWWDRVEEYYKLAK